MATMQKEPFTYVDTSGADLSAIERRAVWGKNLKAPVKEGDKVGEAVYTLNGEEIGRVDIVAAESVEPISYQSAAKDTIDWFLL